MRLGLARAGSCGRVRHKNIKSLIAIPTLRYENGALTVPSLGPEDRRVDLGTAACFDTSIERRNGHNDLEDSTCERSTTPQGTRNAISPAMERSPISKHVLAGTVTFPICLSQLSPSKNYGSRFFRLKFSRCKIQICRRFFKHPKSIRTHQDI